MTRTYFRAAGIVRGGQCRGGAADWQRRLPQSIQGYGCLATFPRHHRRAVLGQTGGSRRLDNVGNFNSTVLDE